jgi:hypothetical protein
VAKDRVTLFSRDREPNIEKLYRSSLSSPLNCIWPAASSVIERYSLIITASSEIFARDHSLSPSEVPDIRCHGAGPIERHSLASKGELKRGNGRLLLSAHRHRPRLALPQLCEAMESTREDLAVPAFERPCRERGLAGNGAPLRCPPNSARIGPTWGMSVKGSWLCNWAHASLPNFSAPFG